MEPTEVGEFTEKMKEAREQNLTRVSLIISVLAVMVAMVTVMGHRTHTEAVLTQARESDRWSEYETRKSRMQETQLAIDALSLQPARDDAAVQAKLKEYGANLNKWKPELDEDASAAKDFEKEVNHAERAASRWDLSEALLEISVVLSSITLLTRHKRYAVVGAIIGAAGAIIGASALLLK